MQYVNRQYPPTEEEKLKREQDKAKREEELRLKNNRLGLNIFQGSWIMVFVCLLIVYWWMGFVPDWRPDASEAPNAIYPTLATIGLIVSAWFSRRGLKRVENTAPEDAVKTPFATDYRIALGLGIVFFLVMMVAYFAVPAHNDGAQFGYIYRLMIGYHAMHAIVIGVMMWRVLQLASDGRYHSENSWSVEATTKLWYFVVVAWLMFYVVLYLPYLW